MGSKLFVRIARRLMSCPTAPYYEAGVRAVVQTICAEHGLEVETDPFGNVLVRLARAPRVRPLVLAAHMDHPGFEVVATPRADRVVLEFNGGVPDTYFRRGLVLRLVPTGVRARLGRRLSKTRRLFEAHIKEVPPSSMHAPRFAVWDLEAFALRGGRIYGRACDDLIGVAAILTTMIELRLRRSSVHVVGVISRAEEVGLQGALTVAAARALRKDSLVISLETSKELAPARMGAGVVIRVGDRTSSFDPLALRYLSEVAGALAARRSKFQFQRALMYGGTCEGTAYQEFGFQTAAVCVALGNYHNCHPAKRIAAEYVSLADACNMVELLLEAALQMRTFDKVTGQLPARFNAMLRGARWRLQTGNE